MKNFFSQTWVVAGLIVIVLGVVCYIAFKKDDKKEEQTKEENAQLPGDTPKGEEE